MLVEIEPYNGNLKLIEDIRNLVEEGYRDIFLAVIVHGSVATNEVIPYSDFDGLLIVRDKHKNTKKLFHFLKKSMDMINRFDPLQHHGWFIIYESQLKSWPQYYFPVELLGFSRTIFPENNITLDITMPDHVDYKKPFTSLSMQLEKKLANNFRPKGMYQLKSFISEILLLPALYYQAKNKRSIFKKYSFDLVRKDVSPEAWEAIEVCNTIRNDWKYSFTIPKWIFLKTKDIKYLKRFTRKYFAPLIPDKMLFLLSDVFYSAVLRLIHEFKFKLNEI